MRGGRGVPSACCGSNALCTQHDWQLTKFCHWKSSANPSTSKACSIYKIALVGGEREGSDVISKEEESVLSHPLQEEYLWFAGFPWKWKWPPSEINESEELEKRRIYTTKAFFQSAAEPFSRPETSISIDSKIFLKIAIQQALFTLGGERERTNDLQRVLSCKMRCHWVFTSDKESKSW